MFFSLRWERRAVSGNAIRERLNPYRRYIAGDVGGLLPHYQRLFVNGLLRNVAVAGTRGVTESAWNLLADVPSVTYWDLDEAMREGEWDSLSSCTVAAPRIREPACSRPVRYPQGHVRSARRRQGNQFPDRPGPGGFASDVFDPGKLLEDGVLLYTTHIELLLDRGPYEAIWRTPSGWENWTE